MKVLTLCLFALLAFALPLAPSHRAEAARIMLLIRPDNLLHQIVPHHVLLPKLHRADPRNPPANLHRLDQPARRMTLSTTGSGDRNLYVSYISEVPVWKTTYRIVPPSKPDKKPLLRGWAIVDNTVGEDWNKVELSRRGRPALLHSATL